MDVFTTYWQRLTRIVGWDDAGISGGRGGYGKSSNCSDMAYFTYFFRWTVTTWSICLYESLLWTTLKFFKENLGRKCVIPEERFVLELPTSRAMLATARPLVLVFHGQQDGLFQKTACMQGSCQPKTTVPRLNWGIEAMTTTGGNWTPNRSNLDYSVQEAFEKCWAHSPLRAASRPFTRCR